MTASLPKVLVVDDEAPILRSTAELLQLLGYQAVCCQEAPRIREAIERERPDLVLQDVRMPGLDLERLIGEVRQDARFASLPIVIFTANMDAEETAQRVGASAFLDKPFRPHDLQRVIKSLLHQQAAYAPQAQAA